MSFHPSVDLMRLDHLASDPEYKVAFAYFDKLSLLTFSDDAFHLISLDVFVKLPLTYACSVLSDPGKCISRALYRASPPLTQL